MFRFIYCNNDLTITITTRMVQLPATPAIEYVAACWVSGAAVARSRLVRGAFVRGFFCPGDFFPGGLLPRALLAGGTFGRGIFVRGVYNPDRNISGALDLQPAQWKDLTVFGVRASSVFPQSSTYTPCACYPYCSGWTLIQADWKRLDSFHVHCQRHILHISWHDFVSNDEVLQRTGLFDVSYIVRKRRLGLFGRVARLRSDVPANLILRI